MSDLSPTLQPPWPPPRVDADVAAIVDDAVNALAATRRLSWLGDGPTEIHLYASLHTEVTRRLADAINLARDQDLPRADIARLAGLDPADLNDPDHPQNEEDTPAHPHN